MGEIEFLIPESVPVFGAKTIIKASSETDKLIDGTVGDLDPRESVIRYEPSLKGDSLKSTLLHELFHQIQFRTSQYQALNPDIMEIIVDTFSIFVAETFELKFKDKFFDDNKEITKQKKTKKGKKK